ncbi:MAG: hypothetical protein GC155_10590 [Alphaproteobacteria bacterium]|nr:hypothetical protein [Alphaproteobacteria bacterium]
MMYGLPKFGDGIGLSRIRRFMLARGLDRIGARSIVVTGSNGKGSTARLLAAALGARGQRVGLFTSPHLFDIRERFVVGDARISQADYERHATTVLAYTDTLPAGDRMGGFEFLFLLALLWFEEQAPDVIVWEAGIGGRYDPVRTLKSRLSLLTGLELEHTQLLGATEELIAYDKIDALAPGGRLIVSPSVAADHRQRISDYCALSDRRPLFVSDDFTVADIDNRPDGTRFQASQPGGAALQVHLNLIGAHQADNALTAFLAACAWLGETPDLFGADNRLNPMLAAMGETSWPGRLEHVASGPDLWIDVGHTPHALDLVTSAYLDFAPAERTLVVFGVSAVKEVSRIAEIVAGRFDHFILTRAHKGGADIDSFASAFAGRDVTIEPDIAKAAQMARARASAEGLGVLALGGMFLAVELQHAWTGGDPAELEFF